MAQESFDDKVERESQEQLAALGTFVRDFEYLVDRVRTEILMIVTARLSTPQIKHQPYVGMILHSRALTAAPLWEILRGMVGQMLGDGLRPDLSRDDILKLVSAINREIEELFSLRNTIVHATWEMGARPRDGESDTWMLMMKNKATIKSGYTSVEGPRSADELIAIGARCRVQAKNITKLIALFTFPEPLALKDLFKQDGKRWLVT
jgi:hypothetical protein